MIKNKITQLQKELIEAIDYLENLKTKVTDINNIEVNDPITISSYPDPGQPSSLVWTTTTT